MMPFKQCIKTTRPSKQEVRALRNLVQAAEKVDGFEIRLYWNILKDRQIPEFDDFFYFIDGKLVAYLALFMFKQDKAEINAVVHPDWRRKGLFSNLLAEATLELKRRRVKRCDFICHTLAKIALEIAKKHAAEWKYSECEMLMTRKINPSDLPEVDDLIPATKEDVQILAEIDSAAFHTNIKRITQRFKANFEEKNRRAWLLSAEGQIVGKAHVRFDDDEVAFIHDLGVLPKFRRKGYAKAMVFQLIGLLKKQGYNKIALDVLRDNEAAIKLYEACGFELIAEHQFWEFPIEKLESSILG